MDDGFAWNSRNDTEILGAPFFHQLPFKVSTSSTKAGNLAQNTTNISLFVKMENTFLAIDDSVLPKILAKQVWQITITKPLETFQDSIRAIIFIGIFCTLLSNKFAESLMKITYLIELEALELWGKLKAPVINTACNLPITKCFKSSSRTLSRSQNSFRVDEGLN